MRQTPHLFAGLVALGLGAMTLFADERVLIHRERTSIASTAPEIFSLKNQGLAFQRADAYAQNVLPIYGSSELLVPASPYRGNNFFRTAPTGFQLSPVGVGGTTPLIMLQKIGAMGSNLRGKKPATAWPQPTLILHRPEQDMECATKLVKQLNTILSPPYPRSDGNLVDVRNLPASFNSTRHVFELWLPPVKAAAKQ